MTDEAKALVERLRRWEATNQLSDQAADLIETQAREIERLREALTMIAHHIRDESDPYEEDYWGCRSIARAALAGNGHDR